MIDDSGHTPHARWTDEEPTTGISFGPRGLKVELLDWGPRNAGTWVAMYGALMANWGEDPTLPRHGRLNAGQWAYIEKAFAGGTLPQVLERFTFSFLVNGCTRACTHELVRTRIGAAFMQHGGRDNDWRHRRWTVPETIRRANEYLSGGLPDKSHCLERASVLEEYLRVRGTRTLQDAIDDVLDECKNLYAAMVDAGIPWQDARRILPIGSQTYIFADYNYLGLKGVLENRLEHVMDWEINCVAQLMVREVWMHCPEFVARNLMSRSDRMQRAAFADLDSWPPDGKYPVTEEQQNKHREHRREQMPYWVLHPLSLKARIEEIVWVPTNGTYPSQEEMQHALQEETGNKYENLLP